MNIDILGVISSAMGCGGSLIAYFSLYQKNDSFKQKVAREYVDRHDFDFGSEDENISNEENKCNKENTQEQANIENQKLLRDCIFNERKKQISIILIILSFSFSLVDCLYISLDCFLIFLLTVVIMFIICFIVRKVSENEKLGKYWTEINKIE